MVTPIMTRIIYRFVILFCPVFCWSDFLHSMNYGAKDKLPLLIINDEKLEKEKIEELKNEKAKLELEKEELKSFLINIFGIS